MAMNVAKRRRLLSDPWLLFSALALVLTMIATIWVFGSAPENCGGIRTLTDASHLLCWMHQLDTIALATTIIWSLLALIGVYYGPEPLWNLYPQLGKGVLLMAELVYIVAIGSCGLGVYMARSGNVRFHLVCIILTEFLFLLFDCILIIKINSWHSGLADLDNDAPPEEKQLFQAALQAALKKKNQLLAWIFYVDMPAFVAFLVLLLGGNYLRSEGVLLNDLEIELFSAGAVFFGLMTANLAFFSANMAYDTERIRLAHN